MQDSLRSKVVFTQEQLEYLKSTYPEHEINPSSTMENVMYRAGQAHVLRLIESRTPVDAAEYFDARRVIRAN